MKSYKIFIDNKLSLNEFGKMPRKFVLIGHDGAAFHFIIFNVKVYTSTPIHCQSHAAQRIKESR